MTLENYLVIGGCFAAAALVLWVRHEIKNPAPVPDDIEAVLMNQPPGVLLPFNPRHPVDCALAALPNLPPAAIDHDAVADMRAICDEVIERDDIHPRCNAVEAAAGPLGATRPPGAHQASAPASAADGGAADADPTIYPRSLRAAVAYVLMHAEELGAVDRVAILAAVGGKGCVDAFYRKGLK